MTLKHRGNLGLDVEEVTFEAGTELAILQEWKDHYLCQDDEGRVFNGPKERIDPS